MNSNLNFKKWKYLYAWLCFALLVGCSPTEYDLYLELEYQKKPIEALKIAAKGLEKKSQYKLIYSQISQKGELLIEQAVLKCQKNKSKLDTVQSVENFSQLNIALEQFLKQSMFVDTILPVLPIIQRGYQETKSNFIAYHDEKAQEAWQEKAYRRAYKHWSLVKKYEKPRTKELDQHLENALKAGSRLIYVAMATNKEMPEHKGFYKGYPVGQWMQTDLLDHMQQHASNFLTIQPLKEKKDHKKVISSKTKETHIIHLFFDIRPAKESEKVTFLAENGLLEQGSQTQSQFGTSPLPINNNYHVLKKSFAYIINASALIQSQQNTNLVNRQQIEELFYKDIIWQKGPEVLDTIQVANIHQRRQLDQLKIDIEEKDILPIVIQKATALLAEKCLTFLEQERISYESAVMN